MSLNFPAVTTRLTSGRIFRNALDFDFRKNIFLICNSGSHRKHENLSENFSVSKIYYLKSRIF